MQSLRPPQPQVGTGVFQNLMFLENDDGALRWY
jgi:hypothetical protein